MKKTSLIDKIHNIRWVLYIFILIYCIVAIGFILYAQFYKEPKIEERPMIRESEQEDEYNDLKSEFVTLFTNNIENTQKENINVSKLRENYDIVVTAYSYKENTEKYNIQAAIPQININNELATNINRQIRTEFRQKAEEIMKQNNISNTVYSVKYIGYVQNNVLSLVIRSELKESNKNQKVVIKAYNYNLITNREVSLEDMLSIKNITTEKADVQIKEEIKKVQDQNKAFEEQGYKLYERDYTSDMYKVESTEEYFLGKNGMIYLIYCYGNQDYTSEMDIVIFK